MAIEKTIELKVDSSDAVEGVQDVTDEVKKLDKAVDKVGDDAKKSMDGVDDGSKKASGGVKRLSGSFKKLGLAIKASGIALIATAFAAIGSIASKQQGSLDTLTTTMTALQLVFNDVLTGGERFKKAGGIQEYFAGILKDAKASTKLINDAALAQARVGQETLKSEIAAEKQRQTRDDITKGYEERIKASRDLFEVLYDQGEETKRLANINLEAAQNQYDLNDSVENHVALIEAETAVLEAENKVVTATSEHRMAHNGLMQEAVTWQREYNDAIHNEIIFKSLRSGTFSAEGEIERDIERNNILIENSRNRIEEINNLTHTSLSEKARMSQEYYDTINTAAEDNANLETGLTDIKAEYALGAAAALAIALSSLAKEGTAEAKAFGISGVIIDAAAAVIATWRGYASFGPWGTAAAIAQTAAIGASSLVAIKKISAADSGGVGGGQISQVSTPQVTAPQFNIVGEGGSNQIVDAINERDTQPIRAYVVGADMTTQQSLDRNIVDNATVV